jgi:16S rRNA (cytosine1402-N4)-methyltransferase
LTCTEDLLLPGGRLVAVTFHSLEDRMVKNFLHRCSGKRALEGKNGICHATGFMNPNLTLLTATDRPVNQFDLKRAAHRRTSRRRKYQQDDDEDHQYIYSGGDSSVHAERPSFELLNKHVVQADENELEVNSRSRSAKLRAARRTQEKPIRPFGKHKSN